MGLRAEAEEFSTLAGLLRVRGCAKSDSLAYAFLPDGESITETLTFGELDRKARGIAAVLRTIARRGDRALLLYPPGLDYVAGLFGCFVAGLAAVPSPAPRTARAVARLKTIVTDARPTVVLSCAAVTEEVRAAFAQDDELGRIPWISTDEIPEATDGAIADPDEDPEGIAYMQYTSGSTSSPKGVMVSNRNLLHTLADTHVGFEHSEESVMVTWLPTFHDLGLIYGLLEPIFIGFPAYVMPPEAFIQKPLRWLSAISRFRGTHTSAPNFAYDLCVRKSTPEERAELDLRSWRVALNAAEPVRAETLKRFRETFAPCGLDPGVVRPGYGLAEGTLKVSMLPIGRAVQVESLEAAALEKDRIVAARPGDPHPRLVVGCGLPALGTVVDIVNPVTKSRSAAGEVGEIWVAGQAVAGGYFGRPEATEETFRARIDGEGSYLRTGDLGFLKGDELFITGRLKDLVIIAGKNHYPQDIEQTFEGTHALLRKGCGAAFAIDGPDEELLVLVQEIELGKVPADLDAILAGMRRAVAEEHDLKVHAIRLIEPRSVPKTSSGKIQRHATRNLFLAQKLKVVAAFTDAAPSAAAESNAIASTTARARPTAPEIEGWLAAKLSASLTAPIGTLSSATRFAEYGIDSRRAIELTGELERWLGRVLPATLFWEHPSVGQLARALALASDEARALADRDRAVPDSSDEPIAIIGIGCRFPGGAVDPDSFWKLLVDGVDAVTEVPAERWRADDVYDPDPSAPGKTISRWGSFLPDVDRFDPLFFEISPREAPSMDPQQRLLLEVAQEAFDDAGQPRETLAGSATSVFVGVAANEYGWLRLGHPDSVDGFTATGSYGAIVANRVSYAFDLRGPSFTVDSVCSSSLVAVHLACQSLRSGESAMALAGGAVLFLTPENNLWFSKLGVLSPDGRCRAFDARANGIVLGEGVGVVVLKRLSAAVADGDPIHAVIRGSALAQDGRSNGLAAPTRAAQEAMLRDAYRRSGVSPADVQFVETHGTGTILGDPIEAQALGAVVGIGRSAENPCFIGSVKTNLGHLSMAGGIASLIKVALSLEHRTIPPNLHFEKANPLIPLAALGLAVPSTMQAWPEGPAHAGVTSLSFGGTNAHIVLCEAPARSFSEASAASSAGFHLLPISAHTPRALAMRVESMLRFVKETSFALDDLCSTASLRRSHHRHRLAVLFAGRDELLAALAAAVRGEPHPRLVKAATPSGSTDSSAPSAPTSLQTLAETYVAGGEVDWLSLEPFRGIVVPLPSVPWQRERYWLDPRENASRPRPVSRSHEPVLGNPIEVAAQPGIWLFELALRADTFAGLNPHRVAGAALLPAAASVEIALAAAERLRPLTSVTLEEIELSRALFLKADETRKGQLVVTRKSADESTFQLFGRTDDDGGWALHVSGRFRFGVVAASSRFSSLNDARARCTRTVSRQEHDEALARWGIEVVGPVLVTDLRTNGPGQGTTEVLATIAVSPVAAGLVDPYCVPPALLDACLQTLASAVPRPEGGQGADATMVVRVGNVTRHAPIGAGRYFCHTRLHPEDASGESRADLTVHDATSAVVLEVRSVVLRRLAAEEEAPRDRNVLIHDVTFQEKRRAISPATSGGRLNGVWLVIEDASDLGSQLKDRLVAAGGMAILLRGGDRPDAALRALAAEGNCRLVIDLSALDLASKDVEDDESVSASMRGCASVLALLGDIAAPEWNAPPPLWIVTRGAVKAGDTTARIALRQAPLWGLARVISEERPEFWGGIVDLDPHADPALAASQLVEELTHSDGEDQIAFRGGARFVRRVIERSGIEGEAESVTPFHLRPDARYLITGGLGGLGLQTAQFLAEHGARNLTLMSRTGLPPRSEWASPVGATIAARIAAVRAIEKRGANVEVVALDVADGAALAAWLSSHSSHSSRSRGAPLRGIFHAAAEVKDELLDTIDASSLACVFRAKAVGAEQLDRVLGGEPLDFFVLFSSIGSLVGVPGQGAYAGANAFLDALAQDRRAQGKPGLAIHWGGIEGAGLAAGEGGRRAGESLARLGLPPIDSHSAFVALARLLADDETAAECGIFARDRSGHAARLPLFGGAGTRSGRASSFRERSPERSVRQLFGALALDRRHAFILEHLTRQLAGVLHVSPSRLDPWQPLGTLGVDSLLSIELRNRLETSLGLRLSATLAWNHPTLDALAAHLVAKLESDLGNGAAPKGTSLVAVKRRAPRPIDALSEAEALDALLGGQ